MQNLPAIQGFDDASAARLVVYQSGKLAHVPALSVGLQPLDAGLTDISGLSPVDGNFIVGDGSNWVAESGATARASLGITNWQSYTPTYTAFGTVSVSSMWWKRIGDTLHLRGKFTAGTTTASEARMSLPSGLTSDATKVPAIQLAGLAITSDAIAGSPCILIESNVGYVTFGFTAASAGGLTKRNGNAFITASGTCSLMAEIPISGW